MTSKPAKKQSQQEIINQFNALRAEQRILLQKISELEAESREHAMVIKTLKGVDQERKCFRMIGGCLVERTVKDILPDLIQNEDQMSKLLETLRKQFEAKGEELQKFNAQHGLIVGAEKEAPEDKKKDEHGGGEGSKPVSGVLVSQ